MIGRVTAAEVAELIAGGEDSFTELKAAATAPKDVAKELCALLNHAGGRVLIGVEDDGQVTGIGSWTEEAAMNLARTLLDPPATPTWQVVDAVGAQVAVLSVGVGIEKPYAVGGGEGKRYYVRAGSTSREASREELIRLTQASGAVAPDLRPVPGSSPSDLDEHALRERFGGRRSIDWDSLSPAGREGVLVNAEIVHPESGTPTVGGLVCFGSRPAASIPHATISCAAYPTTAVGRTLSDRDEIDGRVDDQVRGAVAFVKRNLRVASNVEGVERVDAPMPSEESLREVVANAVAHRDYAIRAPVQVRVFVDRLEVVSPGELPNGVTVEGMRVGVSVRRNPFIVQHLVDRRVIDGLGRGVVLLLEDSVARGLTEPRIETRAGLVIVTLPWT